MENSKAEYLVNYIISVYGHRQFGIFKTLLSVPSVLSIDFPDMSFLSLEKILRESHDIYWARANGEVAVHVGDRHIRYHDDVFGSVTGVIAERAKLVFSQYSDFPTGPQIQTGGQSVAAMLQALKLDEFHCEVVTMLPGYDDTDVGSHADYYRSVLKDYRSVESMPETHPGKKYRRVEVLHKLLVLMRLDPDLGKIDFERTNVDVPFASSVQEFQLFLSGKLKRSIQSPDPINPAMLAAIRQMYGGGEVSDDKCKVIFREFDPFKHLNSKAVYVPENPFDISGGSVQAAVAAVKESTTVDTTLPTVEGGSPNDALEKAIALLEKYYNADYNGLSKEAEKVEARYGSRAGKLIWDQYFKGANQTRLKDLFDQDRYTINDWLAKAVPFIRERIRTRDDDVVLYLLVAARIVACKNAYGVDFNVNPIEVFKR